MVGMPWKTDPDQPDPHPYMPLLAPTDVPMPPPAKQPTPLYAYGWYRTDSATPDYERTHRDYEPVVACTTNYATLAQAVLAAHLQRLPAAEEHDSLAATLASNASQHSADLLGYDGWAYWWRRLV